MTKKKTCFIVCLVLLFLFTLLYQPIKVARVSGHSMDTTLHDGQFLLFFHGAPKTGEIGIFPTPTSWGLGEEWVVKRLVATEGDHLVITDKEVYINDTKVTNFYDTMNIVNEKPLDITLQKGQYFFMGDNRGHSFDSLYAYLTGHDNYLVSKVPFHRAVKENG